VNWSNARHDASDPILRKRSSTGIRSDALLLPASLRYDWQHSSSQLPIIIMTPAGSPPPAGVIFAPCAWRAAGAAAFSRKIVGASPHVRGICPILAQYMRRAHGCHSNRALPRRDGRIYIVLIGRATISSSQRPRQDWRPLLLPSCQSRPATPAGPPPPAGVAFCTALTAQRIASFTFVARARNLARILPKFPLDMHETHMCRAIPALFISAMQRIFHLIRSGRRQGRAAAQQEAQKGVKT